MLQEMAMYIIKCKTKVNAMKKIITALLLVAFVSPVFAQTEELNLQKYWYYRYRLSRKLSH